MITSWKRLAVLFAVSVVFTSCKKSEQAEVKVAPYERIKFFPYDQAGALIPDESHSFAGTGFVIEAGSKLANSGNLLLSDVPVNRFEAGAERCVAYLKSAKLSQAQWAVSLYNDSLTDSRVSRVSNFDAQCIEITYLGKQCEKSIDDHTSELVKNPEKYAPEEVYKNPRFAAIAVVIAEQQKAEQCHPKKPVSSTYCFADSDVCARRNQVAR